MGRGAKPEVFDLNASSLAVPVRRVLSHRHILVLDLPAGGEGVTELALEDGTFFPIHSGLKLSACEGAVFQSVTVRSAAVGGSLTLLCANDDAVPFLSAGSAGGSLLRRIFDFTIGPWEPSSAGAILNPQARGVGGASAYSILAIENAGLGVDPVISVRGHRCMQHRPATGTSGFIGTLSFPWQRLRNEPGVGGGVLSSVLHGRLTSFGIFLNLRREGVGAKGDGTGLQIAQGRGTIESLAGNNAGMGIVGNGAAWWRFVVRAVDAGPYTIDDALPLVAADARTWTRGGIALENANPTLGRDGRVSVYWNGALFRTYTDMTLFPPAFDGGDSTGFDWRLTDAGASADALQWSYLHVFADAFMGAPE